MVEFLTKNSEILNTIWLRNRTIELKNTHLNNKLIDSKMVVHNRLRNTESSIALLK